MKTLQNTAETLQNTAKTALWGSPDGAPAHQILLPWGTNDAFTTGLLCFTKTMLHLNPPSHQKTHQATPNAFNFSTSTTGASALFAQSFCAQSFWAQSFLHPFSALSLKIKEKNPPGSIQLDLAGVPLRIRVVYSIAPHLNVDFHPNPGVGAKGIKSLIPFASTQRFP